MGNATTNEWVKIPKSRLLDAVNTVIACLAVLGNGMVITVMLLRRRVFSSFTNRLILHQSVIDSIAGVVFLFSRVVLQSSYKSVSFEGNVYDQFICRVINSEVFLWCVSVTSTYNLVIISLERFMATCHPVKHRNTWSAAKLKLAMASAWGIGVMYSSHIMFVFESHQGGCRPTEMETGLKMLEILVVVVIEYLVPITILMYTYSQILIMLTRKIANQGQGLRNGAMSKAKKNVLVTTMLISVMFVVCWTPSEVWLVYAHASGDWGGWLYATVFILIACNMSVNPVIYCFKYESFRSQLANIIQTRFRRKHVVNGEAVSTPEHATEMHPDDY